MNAIMRKIFIGFAAALVAYSCASAQPPAASSPTTASSAMKAVSKRFALVGSEGVLVEVVDFEDGEALLRITGVEGPLQNKVLSHRRGLEGSDLRYITQWSGREWLTLLRSGDSAWLGTYWRLSMPGQEAIPVAYSEPHSEKVDADSLFAAHQKQRSAGELDNIGRFDQSAERRHEDEIVATSVQAASRECGSALKASIAWDTLSDRALREQSVSDWCASALRAVKSACYSSPELKSFVQQQVKEVSCRFDGNGEMSLQGGRLTWSMNLNLGDVDTLANKAFSRIYQPEESEPSASNGSPSGSR